MSIAGAIATTSATRRLTLLLSRRKVWEGWRDEMALCCGLGPSNLLARKLLGGSRGGQHHHKLLDHVVMLLGALCSVGGNLLH